MKKISVTILCLVTLLAAVCTAPDAEASGFLGDYCWTAQQTGATVTALLKLGLFDLGGNHVIFGGTLKFDNGFLVPYQGNMEVIAGAYVGTLVNAGGLGTRVFNQNVTFILDHASMNGIYEGVGEFFDTATSVASTLRDTGTLTKTDCP
jgi:hypothetical protein